MSAPVCAECQHELDEHNSDGCTNGWLWDSLDDDWDYDWSLENGACRCFKDREGRG